MPIADAEVADYSYSILTGLRAVILNLVTEAVYLGHFDSY